MKMPELSHFCNEPVIKREHSHTLYQIKLPQGHGMADVYPVLPGVEIVCLNIQSNAYRPPVHSERQIMELNHCHEGRAECIMKDGCLQYIGEGDLFMSMESNHSSTIELPLGYYKGIVTVLDLEILGKALPNLLPELDFDLQGIVEGFFMQDDCFLIQAKEEVRNLFNGMYTVSEDAKSSYFGLKAQELLIYLRCFDPAAEKQKRVYGRQQVEVVKQVQKQLTIEPDRRFTIEELARQHGISPTMLKSNFKGVYGTSIAAYMKEYRIRQAALLLRETEKSVAEIAAEMGYQS